ncbi:MAG: hypothetical protein HYY50_00005 [Candidatus Kerfeldbacteria bacterium]|nr:hypothetical protein [Candidatus Kerfeldbacteria bacterium]
MDPRGYLGIVPPVWHEAFLRLMAGEDPDPHFAEFARGNQMCQLAI